MLSSHRDKYVLNVLNALHKCYLMWLTQHMDVVMLDVDYYRCSLITETKAAFFEEMGWLAQSRDFR